MDDFFAWLADRPTWVLWAIQVAVFVPCAVVIAWAALVRPGLVTFGGVLVAVTAWSVIRSTLVRIQGLYDA